MLCKYCGSEIKAGDRFCGGCGRHPGPADDPRGVESSGPTGRESLLRSIEEALSGNPLLSVFRSEKADLEMKSVLADASWGVGKKKVEFFACMLAREADRKVVYWEMIKETGAGMRIFGFFKAEKFSSEGRTISGRVREAGYGPGGKIIDYDWDYSRTRGIVERVVRDNGWEFTTTLFKSKAMY